MKEVTEIYNELIETYGVQEETLQVITEVNGYCIETLNDVIYALFGFNDIEQLREEY